MPKHVRPGRTGWAIIAVLIAAAAGLALVLGIAMPSHVSPARPLASAPRPYHSAPASVAGPREGPVSHHNTVRLAGHAGRYVVRAGDCLWSIAQAIYHHGSSWVKLAQENHISAPWTIYRGEVLRT